LNHYSTHCLGVTILFQNSGSGVRCIAGLDTCS